MVCLVQMQVRAWRYTGVGLALGCVVLWGWEHPVEAQTFMQSSKVEVMGGVGGIPEVASGSWYFTPTLNVAATIWATEHWGASVWYTNATAEVEYVANKWFRDQILISQLSLSYRHRISGSRTYGYIGVSPWHYRTRKRWTGRTTESDLAFVEQSGQNTLRIELSVGRAVFRRFSIRVGGHLGGGYTPNLVLAGAYSFF